MNTNTTGISRAMRVRTLTSVLLASTALSGVALAQEADTGNKIEKVTVTAQKRTENIQDVPASIQALSTKRLEDLQVSDVTDYSKFLPSVTIQSTSPGFVGIYMRGVASGENRNHSGPSPSVGTYLDETPITTITGALDVHVYDIERVESLSGPQGTLYGANSQSGTIRIITNKPDTEEFSAAYSVEGNVVDHGGIGGIAEGYVNAPLSDSVAIRLVGWTKHDAGYIDNVFGERHYFTANVDEDNRDLVEDDYNYVDTYGARAALKIDLNDNWTILPTVMAQSERSNGVFGFDPSVGDLEVSHGLPEWQDDRWVLAALTVQGKVADLDMTYAGAYLDRTVDAESDYADYGYFYDLGGSTFTSEDGVTLANPAQAIWGRDGYDIQSHELRFASPAENRFRFIGGLFYQKQIHDIRQRYLIDNLLDAIEVPGLEDTIWLTAQQRVDIDKAVYGEISYDLTERLTATGGLRLFQAKGSLVGFFGYGAGLSPVTGEAACFSPVPVTPLAPCTNIDKSTEEDGFTHKLNLAYDLDVDQMVYITWSTGYRPGGVNRAGDLAPFDSDFLTNYEVGWKTTNSDGTFRFNGAIFLQEWEDFQFSFTGLNGLTRIQNAGSATIKGVESDIAWAATDGLTIIAAATYLNTEFSPNEGFPASESDLPVVPDFKGSMTARYEFPLDDWEAFAQGALVYQTSTGIDLRRDESDIIGRLPSYTLVDLSTGADKGPYSITFFVNNLFDDRAVITRTTQCQISVCGPQPYDVPSQPRTFGVKFGQRF